MKQFFSFCFLAFFCSTNFALDIEDSLKKRVSSQSTKSKVKKNTEINSVELSNAISIFEVHGSDNLNYLFKNDKNYVLQGSLYQITELMFVSPKAWSLPTRYRLNKKGGVKYTNSSLVEI